MGQAASGAAVLPVPRPRVIHLDGPSGIGKSTLARRYADDHPDTLCLDIDLLRTMVGGWREHYSRSGPLMRTTALAMLTTWLANGHDVVVPQLVSDAYELGRFRAAAEAGGAEFVTVVLWADLPESVRRFRTRPTYQPWQRLVEDLVDQAGGEPLVRHHAALARLVERDPEVVVIESVAGEIDRTYAKLLLALREVWERPR